MFHRIARVFALTLALAGLLLGSLPAPAAAVGTLGTIQGHVTNAATGAPIANVCMWIGPVLVPRTDPRTNCTFTDGAGFYSHSWVNGPATIDLHFEKAPAYTQADASTVVNSDTPVTVDVALTPTGIPDGCSPATGATATQTLYLPNVTKTLGGPQGFQTPFIVQNTGSVATSLELSFYRFSDGSCIARRNIQVLAPGASYADVPNNDLDLPDNTQFSVTVRSFGANVVSVVNQHKGTVEADAYSGAASGTTTVYLPNVVRRFYGFHSPAIIQNLGQTQTIVTATYVSFDGSAPTKSFQRSIAPGQSQFIEPNSDDPNVGAPGLVDGKQYAVTLTSGQPISVVLNTHNDDPGVAQPVFYSANGISTGAATVYGAYAVKNANGNRISTIVVENVGSGPVTPSLTFTPFGGGATQTFTSPSPIGTGASWAFDPRFTNGVASLDQSKLCATASSTCLGSGEYSFVANANGGSVAAVINVIGPDSAMGYSASSTPAANYFLPNVLASYGGWTTPIYLQSVTASGATLTWTPFTGGASVTQTISLTPGQTTRIDPNASVPQGKQYAVTVTGSGGTLAAIVMELNVSGGDNAMIYGGFPAP